MLHANIAIGTERSSGQTSVIPSSGITAALGVGKSPASQGKDIPSVRRRSNAHHHPQTAVLHQAWGPRLAGLPPDAQQTGVQRLAGMPDSTISKSQAQFRQQLGSRASLREPVSKDPLRTNVPKPVTSTY